jgi:O-antigen/teichoic acid export membrane protein
LVLSVAVLLSGIWFADALIALLFFRGRMDADAIIQITTLTRIALCSVPFLGISSLAGTALNAQQRTGLVLRATCVCLASLPLLALPGLWLHSAPWLMAAVVAFQILLALLILHWAGIAWVGPHGWLDRRIVLCMLSMMALAGVFYGFDKLFLSEQNRWWRCVLSGITFLATVWVGVRLSAHTSNQNNEKID